METKRYEVVIKTAVGESDKAVGKQEIKGAEKREKESLTNAEVLASKGKELKATIGTIAGLYATSQLVVQPIMREKVNMSVLTGDIVQAKNFQRTQNNVNKIVGKGMEIASIGATFLISRTAGFVALGMSVSKEISSGVNRYQNNKMMEAKAEIDSFINSYDRARMSNLIRG